MVSADLRFSGLLGARSRLVVARRLAGRDDPASIMVQTGPSRRRGVTAHVGDTIEWVNKDFILHTATARDKSFDVKIPANATASFTLKQAGEIDYYCRVHPNMTGHISVSAP